MTEQNVETQQQTPEPDYSRGIGQPSQVGKYEDMQVARPVPKETFGEEIFEGDQTGIEKAAEEVVRRREETREERQAKVPLERQYLQQSGEHRGKPIQRNETISAEQAAHDLAGARTDEQTVEQAGQDLELQQAIDALRAGDSAQPEQQPQPQPQQEQPQLEQPPAEPQPAQADIWQNPDVINQVSAYVSQVQNAVQQTEAKYAAELQANSQLAAASLLNSYPELQNVPVEQIGAVIAGIESQNPQRGAEIRNQLSNVSRMAEKAQQAQAAQVQAYQQQHRQVFDYVAAQADDAYEKWITQQEPSPERRQEISTTAKQMLREAGLSDQEMSYHWSTNPILRSFAGQQIMADAARYRMSVAAARGKAVRPIPVVQRPGSPVERSSDQEYALRDLNQKLNSSHSAKDAAALLTARRAGRR